MSKKVIMTSQDIRRTLARIAHERGKSYGKRLLVDSLPVYRQTALFADLPPGYWRLTRLESADAQGCLR